MKMNTTMKKTVDPQVSEFVKSIYPSFVVGLYKRELKSNIDNYLAGLNSSLDSGKDWERRFLDTQAVDDFRGKLEKHRSTHQEMWGKADNDEVSSELSRFSDAKYEVMKKLGLGPAFGAVDMHFDTYIKAVQDARADCMMGLITSHQLNGKVLSIVLNYLSHKLNDEEGLIVNMWLQNMFKGLFEGKGVLVDAL